MNDNIPHTPFSTGLSGSAKETERRIRNIFSGPKKRPPVLVLTLIFTVCLLCGNLVSFRAQAAAADSPSIFSQTGLGLTALFDRFQSLFTSLPTNTNASGTPSSDLERYYKADSLPLFQIAFSKLNTEEQNAWLERLYSDGDFAFFSVAADVLDDGSPLPAAFAKTAYEDGEIAFFSILANRMDKTELESWLDRALADGNWSFQSMLFDRLDRRDEFDEQKEKNEKAWAEAQLAEYRAVGVTKDGKNYYYQGQLVNIFLDMQSNQSFYTLDTNPAGIVNIKIIRNSNNEITGVAYMTEAEVSELLDERREEAEEEKDALKAASKAASKAAWLAEHGDNWEPDTDAPKNKLEIPVNLETVAGGEVVWLGEYALSEGDRIRYNVSAKTGSRLQIGFAKPGDKDLNVTYYSVNNLRKDGGILNCNADMTFRSPATPGTYALFLWAPEDALGHVTGSISLERSAP